MSKRLKIFLFPLYYLIYLANLADCAGVISHLTFLARATPKYFEEYSPWYKAGAFFPDALYSCNNNKQWTDFAEASHWPPFLLNGIKLWKAKYGYNEQVRSSQDSKKLQAFLTGVLTHQISDTSWHSLVDNYRDHGLIKVLSELEFQGNIDKAHNFVDFFGDFVELNSVIRKIDQENWDHYTNTNWSLPKENDIMELLDMNGLSRKQITYNELKMCVIQRGLVASKSEMLTVSNKNHLPLKLAYNSCPRIRNFLQDHWMGGGLDIISMIRNCVTQFELLFRTEFIEDSQFLDTIQFCQNLPTVHNNEASSFHITTALNNRIHISPDNLEPSNFGESLSFGDFENDNKPYLAISAPLQDLTGKVYLLPWDQVQSLYSIKSKHILNIKKTEPVMGMKGKYLDKILLDSKTFLLISEPGSNSVSFYNNGRVHLTITDDSPFVHQLKIGGVGHIDDDRIPDLVLRSEYYGDKETGKLIIVPSSSFMEYIAKNGLSKDEKEKNLNLADLHTISLNGSPYSYPYQHFGSAVAITDRYLYVAIQNLGIVYAYQLTGLSQDSLPKYYIKQQKIYLNKKGSSRVFKLENSKTHRMFGKVIKSWEYNGQVYIAVSQHLLNKVFIYKENGPTLQFLIELKLFTLSETFPMSVEFGNQFEYCKSSNVIYISAPGSFDNLGAIWKISMADLIKEIEEKHSRSIIMRSLRYLHMINPQYNSSGYSNFGKSLLVNDEGTLFIGVPNFNYGHLYSNQLTGEVIIDQK
ncbi:hypothetical protein TBLA_0D05660 [Henningerozyma blattae CBS 6284]|uniref:Phospholipase C/D domain-containing protein n=1 Tax=Henningerozyma blattae (strain ATCC 34711 / CBS 6284 / DSM 70876 / NBRC 10599 / NRRL Y-10934 / UCD 77-7) TaxID=1071380 RepID=I2H3V6_HENB6|nr:hypothetical protein TBLA_0D05660 [Tetrapisispora blattae CBS 6284]CCH61058.1 hypothetical protein TBLA_0D05660 [Tetrapisispora blattae CBS 6284]